MDVREKLVELLLQEDDVCEPSECKDCGANGSCYYHRAANRIIANGVTVQQWIAVKDRLPDVNTNKYGYESKGVIVLIEGRKKSAYRIYERACNRGKTVYRWKYPWDRISDEHITHWMEMPQPTKGE